jgi:general secretion pathway protein K
MNVRVIRHPLSIIRDPSSVVRSERSAGSARRPEGAALLAVLFIIGLLSTLVATSALLLREDVETLSVRRQMFTARMYAEMGLAVAAHPDVRPDDPILRREVYPGEGYIVTMRGEDGKLNPNLLLQRGDEDTFMRVFRAWGLQMKDAQLLLANMKDWVDQDPFQTTPMSWEARQYARPGFPFNRPFRSVDEMSLVNGMQFVERMYPGWRDWFSTLSTGVVDINEAPADVISALTGADPKFAQQLIARRLGRDGMRNTQDDAPFPDVQSALSMLHVSANPQAMQNVLGVRSSITRVEVVGVVSDFRRTLYAVLNRGINPVAQMPPGQTPVGGVPQGGGGGGGFGSAILWLGESDSRQAGSSGGGEVTEFAKPKRGGRSR